MKYSITKTVNSECITQYTYTVGKVTLFGFKIKEVPLKEHDLPIWFLNFMDKTGVFMTRDGDSILISGMENNYNRVLERSSTSFEINTYNRLRVGDYIVYDPRFDDVYATNSDGFIKLLETISGYRLELDTCSEDASAIDDVDNDMNGSNNAMDPSTGVVNYSKAEQYQEIRTLAKMFSDLVDNLVPKSREASLAQTKIEEAVMWANAGITRNITKED